MSPEWCCVRFCVLRWHLPCALTSEFKQVGTQTIKGLYARPVIHALDIGFTIPTHLCVRNSFSRWLNITVSRQQFRGPRCKFFFAYLNKSRLFGVPRKFNIMEYKNTAEFWDSKAWEIESCFQIFPRIAANTSAFVDATLWQGFSWGFPFPCLGAFVVRWDVSA